MKQVDERPFVRVCSWCDTNRQYVVLDPADQSCPVCGDVQFCLIYDGQVRRRRVMRTDGNNLWVEAELGS